jgi:hypothetical protein
MARKHTGGERVAAGDYWDLYRGLRFTATEGAILPGDGTVIWWQLPAVVVLAISPVLGLLFAMYLPAAGIGYLAGFVGQKIGALVRPGGAAPGAGKDPSGLAGGRS